jgi:hypothetical protein
VVLACFCDLCTKFITPSLVPLHLRIDTATPDLRSIVLLRCPLSKVGLVHQALDIVYHDLFGEIIQSRPNFQPSSTLLPDTCIVVGESRWLTEMLFFSFPEDASL